mgnify:FL=1
MKLIRSRVLLSSLIVLVALSAGFAASSNAASTGFDARGVMNDNLAFTAVIEDSQVETFPLPNGAALITRKHRVYEPMMDVYRLGPDGSPDKSFGDHGVLRSELAEGLSVLPDGRFLTWGRLLGNENGPDVAVRRFKGDGRTDESFGSGGQVRYDLGEVDHPVTLTVLADGSYLIQAIAGCGSPWSRCYEGSMDRTVFTLLGKAGQLTGQGKAIQGVYGTPVETPNGDIWALGRHETNYFGPVPGALVKIGPGLGDNLIREFGENEVVSNDLAVGFDGSLFMLRDFNPNAVYRLNEDGSDDPDFGPGGSVTCEDPDPDPDFGFGNSRPSLQVDRQGRILVRSDRCDLSRLLPGGAPDSGFGNNGIADLKAIDMSFANARATLDDGLLLAKWDSETSSIRYVKLKPDGDPDPDYGSSSGNLIPADSPNSDAARALLLGKNGKFTVGGASRCAGRPVQSTADCSGLALARYGYAGNADKTFGESGKVLEDGYYRSVNTMKAGKTGAFIVAGNGIEKPNPVPAEQAYPTFFMAKYSESGELDTSFGDGGRVFTDPTEFGSDSSEGSYISAIDFQRDGSIVATGYARDCGGAQFCLPVVRYHRDGSLDKSFGDDGIFRLAGGAVFGRSVRVQKNGKILIGATEDVDNLIVIRLRKNGTLDPTWGRGGIARPKIARKPLVKLSPNSNVPSHVATDIIPTSDGGILVSGEEDRYTQQGVVIKLNRKGRLDSGFARGGVAYTGGLQAADMARDRCGRINLAGRAPGGHAAMLRLTPRGNADRSFPGRKLYFPFGKKTSSELNAIGVTANNRLFAAGRVERLTTSNDVAVVRLKVPACRR